MKISGTRLGLAVFVLIAVATVSTSYISTFFDSPSSAAAINELSSITPLPCEALNSSDLAKHLPHTAPLETSSCERFARSQLQCEDRRPSSTVCLGVCWEGFLLHYRESDCILCKGIARLRLDAIEGHVLQRGDRKSRKEHQP